MNTSITFKNYKFKYFWYNFLNKALPKRIKRMIVVSAVVGYVTRSCKDFEEIIMNVSSLLNTTVQDKRASLAPAYFRKIIINEKTLSHVILRNTKNAIIKPKQLTPEYFSDSRLLKEFSKIVTDNLPAWVIYDTRVNILKDVTMALETAHIEETVRLIHAG